MEIFTKCRFLLAFKMFLIIFLLNISCNEKISPNKSKAIRLYPPPSLGLENDAKVLKEAITSQSDKEVKIEDVKTKQFELAKINIFLEKIYPEIMPFGKENWVVVNWEHIYDLKLISQVDRVLCKTKTTVSALKNLKKRKGYSFEVDYIGFTSLVRKGLDDLEEKDYKLFLHPAGKSSYKQTDVVLDTWRVNPHFPKLVLTCVDTGKETDCANTFLKGKNSAENIASYSNIEMYTEYIPHETLNFYKKKAGFVVAPSAIEGFGHYINEAKGAGAIVLTTDYPPMNELISDDFGILIDSKDGDRKQGVLQIPHQKISVNSLEKAVNEAINLSEKKRKVMARKAIKSFQQQKEKFTQNIGKLIKKVYGAEN